MDATVNTQLCFDVDDTNYEVDYLDNPLLMFNGPVCISNSFHFSATTHLSATFCVSQIPGNILTRSFFSCMAGRSGGVKRYMEAADACPCLWPRTALQG